MIDNKKILALIPARGGSKGIPDKNIIDLNGQPLIAYSIIEAKKSKYIDKLILSTDSKKIADIALNFGCEVPFMRPIELAQDNSKTIDAVVHAIDYLKSVGDNYDILLLLQPTTPLRTVGDIDRAIELFTNQNYKSLASISPVNDHPVLIRTIDNNYYMKKLLNQSSTIRRQDMPNYFRVNGAIYINLISEITNETSFNDNNIGFIMPNERSIDIDDYVDLKIAEEYLIRMEK